MIPLQRIESSTVNAYVAVADVAQASWAGQSGLRGPRIFLLPQFGPFSKTGLRKPSRYHRRLFA